MHSPPAPFRVPDGAADALNRVSSPPRLRVPQQLPGQAPSRPTSAWSASTARVHNLSPPPFRANGNDARATTSAGSRPSAVRVFRPEEEDVDSPDSLGSPGRLWSPGRLARASSPGRGPILRSAAVVDDNALGTDDASPPDEPDDVFTAIMDEAKKEHRRKVAKLQKEIDEMKEKMNSVLSATWRFSEETWHGSVPHSPGKGTLELSTTISTGTGSTPQKETVWTVAPAQDADDMNKVMHSMSSASDRPQAYKARRIWIEQQEETADTIQLSEREAIVKVISGFTNSVSPLDKKIEIRGVEFAFHHLAWDFLGITLLLYDIVMGPIGAFGYHDSLFFVAMDHVILIFWTIDLTISVISDRQRRKRGRGGYRYMHSLQFAADSGLVAVDWIFRIIKVLGHLHGDTPSLILRSVRILRMYRLVRSSTLHSAWLHIKDHIKSELVFLVPAVLQVVAFTVLICHFLGSAWYLFGVLQHQGGQTWIQEYQIQNEPLAYRYFISILWAFGRFSLSPTDLTPQNTAEGCFGVFVTIIGIAVFLWSVASINQSLMEARSLDSEASKEFWLLRRYLRQHDVPSALSARVLQYAESACRRQFELVPESKVRALSFLSDQLVSELKCAVSYSAMWTHPLLKQIMSKPHLVQGLVTNALWPKTFAARDAVFAYGTTARHMMVVSKGEFTYTKHRSGTPKQLEVGDWLCEQCLWVNWMHRGEASAVADSQLIMLKADAFGEVVRRDTVMHSLLCKYVTHYLERLNRNAEEEDNHRRDESFISDAAVGDESPAIVQDLLNMANHDHHDNIGLLAHAPDVTKSIQRTSKRVGDLLQQQGQRISTISSMSAMSRMSRLSSFRSSRSQVFT